MTDPVKVEATVEFKRRQSLEATIIRACEKCSAPGVYSSEERIKQGWPGSFDLAKEGRPVGDKCPNCGSYRPIDENRGEIWSKVHT